MRTTSAVFPSLSESPSGGAWKAGGWLPWSSPFIHAQPSPVRLQLNDRHVRIQLFLLRVIPSASNLPSFPRSFLLLSHLALFFSSSPTARADLRDDGVDEAPALHGGTLRLGLARGHHARHPEEGEQLRTRATVRRRPSCSPHPLPRPYLLRMSGS